MAPPHRPINSLEGSMSVQAKYCGSDRRWYMYIYICEALRDCFRFISMLKASINSRQISVSFGKECKRQCHEDAAVKF